MESDTEPAKTRRRFNLLFWLLGAAGLVVTGVFSGWQAAVIYAVAYLAVFVPGWLHVPRSAVIFGGVERDPDRTELNVVAGCSYPLQSTPARKPLSSNDGGHLSRKVSSVSLCQTGMMAGLEELVVRDAARWRTWLTRNHATSPAVWLVLAKKDTIEPTRLTYDQALEEALCRGWIDGQLRRRDSATYYQRFSRRRQRSAWSKRNVVIAERLVAEGRMHPAGLAELASAKADGRLDAAYAGSSSIEVPPDLVAALAAEPKAQVMFDTLSRQNRYAVLYRIGTAKRLETRERRIKQFVQMLAEGQTLHPQKDI